MKKRTGGAKRRHTNGGQADTLIYQPRPYRLVRVGISRHAQPRAETPMSDAQAEVLALLTTELQSVVPLAEALGRSVSGVTASLYALSGRGLAERVPCEGWRLA